MRVGSPFHFIPRPMSISHGDQHVEYDVEDINQDIARKALELLQGKSSSVPIFTSLLNPSAEVGLMARLPCRFEYIHCEVDLDSTEGTTVHIFIDRSVLSLLT